MPSLIIKISKLDLIDHKGASSPPDPRYDELLVRLVHIIPGAVFLPSKDLPCIFSDPGYSAIIKEHAVRFVPSRKHHIQQYGIIALTK
jgi:hypothetical protein